MSSTKAVVSTKFPEGYGDFVLRSQDKVLCYFPSTILGHASSVFKDMLALGPKGASTATTVAPVDVAETINTLDLFLRHLDPNHVPPPIDPDTIEDLLQAAHKYQTDAILRWFRAEAIVSRENAVTCASKKAFVISHPLLALTVAVRFGLVDITRIALRELSGCDSQMLAANTQNLALPLYLAVLQLRERRLALYETHIEHLAKYTSGEVKFGPDGSMRGGMSGRVSAPAGCMDCTATRARWVFSIMKAVRNRPRWDSFIEAYEVVHECAQCSRSWNNLFRGNLDRWRQEAKQNEDKVPDWPM